jgi:myosin heavy subunit
VPLAALHEERRRRAEAEQTARQLQQQFEQLQAAMRQAQQPQAPDPEQDPMGYLAFQNQQLQQQLAELGQWRQQTEQQRQQVQQYQGFVQAVASSEAAFRQTHADYDQAAQYAMQFEDKRLQAFYPDPATRQRVLQMEAANMLQQAMQQGRDPAEVLYQAARNMGYAGPAAAGAAAAAAPPAAAPVAPVPSDAADKIRKGLAQQSTVAAGGSTPPGEMTPEALAAISDPAEFNKQWGKVFKRR